MADPAITCAAPNVSLNELLNSVRVTKISTGETGLRAIFLTAAANDIQGIGCAEVPLSDTEVIRLSFGLTATGETAIVFITET